MKQAVSLAKKMYKEPEKNYLPELEEINLHTVFRPVYQKQFDFIVPNQISSFIILAYDNDSPWLDPRKDRRENKISILDGIGVDPKSRVFQEIVDYENDKIQEVILNYLLSCTDARWQEVASLLDYSSKMILYCNRRVTEKNKVDTKLSEDGKVVEDVYEYLDPLEVSKINKEKGDLLLKAIEARKTAEEILKRMENEFQKIDSSTQADFGFTFSDPKKYDVLSWEHRIKKRKQTL